MTSEDEWIGLIDEWWARHHDLISFLPFTEAVVDPERLTAFQKLEDAELAIRILIQAVAYHTPPDAEEGSVHRGD